MPESFKEAAAWFVTYVGPPGLLFMLWRIRGAVRDVSARVAKLEDFHERCPVARAMAMEAEK